jgi:LmbE family N-acetylglucosaminyl deacetylase
VIEAGKVLVVAPHPDDETLGCGGTLLRLKNCGVQIFWLIVTAMHPKYFSDDAIIKRDGEIEKAAKLYGFDKVIKMDIPTTKVDTIPSGELVGKFTDILREVEPNTILIPHHGDIHTDHQHTVKAVLSCCKWFRFPFIKNILCYETISETDFNILSGEGVFSPNVYADITSFFEMKMEIMKVFSGELGAFPFPRSEESIESLARLRGSQCGAERAEAFQLLKGCF